MYKLKYKLKDEVKWITMKRNFRKKSIAEKEGYKLLKEKKIIDFQVVEDIITKRRRRYDELASKYKYNKKGLVRLASRHSRLDMSHLVKEPTSILITFILDEELPVR